MTDADVGGIAWVNGSFVRETQARVSIFDRGFLFADGVYEVTAVLDGNLVDSVSHIDRLMRSLAAIALPVGESADEIVQTQRALVLRNSLTEGIVYTQVTRGAARREFLCKGGVRPTTVMFCQQKEIVTNPSVEIGISVKTTPDLRWARRDIKSVALLPQVLAKRSAAEAGCEEAWLIEDGMITEGASSSVFVVSGEDAVVTRPNTASILAGCTRNALVAMAREGGFRVEERTISVEEALCAREAFVSSASTFILPVVMIDGCRVGNGKPGPTTLRLRELYVQLARALG